MNASRKAVEAWLSKSQYLRGLQCQKALWLYRHRRDLIPETPPSLDAIFEQGAKVGQLAWKRFPGGQLIDADHLHIREALEATRVAIAAGAKILYEAAIVHERVLVRLDILLRAGSTWDMVEVKSSTEVKDEYLDDMAIQKFVLDGAGFPIRKCFVMHVNNQYIRQGEIDPEKFFVLADITRDVAALQGEVPARVAAMQKAIALPSSPKIKIGPYCSKPHECLFMEHCWRHIPDYSVYDLTRVRQERAGALIDMGILHICDIPDDFPLTTAQALQAAVEKSGKPHIDVKAIAKLLAEPVYPLHFLDFETIWPAIPPYDGLRPFQQLPFQASLHIQRTKSGMVEHLEYLGDAKTDPRPGLVEFLTGAIAPRGSVVAYNAPFEGGRLAEMADAYPRSGAILRSIEARLWDLMTPFQNQLYVHPESRGKYSIKKVLPALVPEMTYEGMGIARGGDASIAYLNLMEGVFSAAEAKETVRALKEYCGQDTLAMVKLLDHLRHIAPPSRG